VLASKKEMRRGCLCTTPARKTNKKKVSQTGFFWGAAASVDIHADRGGKRAKGRDFGIKMKGERKRLATQKKKKKTLY